MRSSGLILMMIIGCLNSFAQDTLAYWGLNETSGTITKEKLTNTDYTIHSKWPVIERVPGIRQNGLRADGYTFWVDGNVTNPYPTDFFSVSAWVALETYPVTTAAIWSYYDAGLNQGAYLSINKFGNIVVNFRANNQQTIITSTTRAEHYKWSFIVLNVDAVAGNCKLYLNGVEIMNQGFTAGVLSWPSVKTYLGRSAATETVQTIFPINYLNTMIDEVVVRKRILTPLEISQEYASLNPVSAPDMATPSTRFATDFHRPAYHAIPNNGWCNESHGLIFYNGVYHMFYQKNGNGPYFSQQNWGHLTSTNLVNWQEKQVALFPQPGWESVGTWSGHCILDNGGNPVIFYTGVDGVKAGQGSAQATGSLLNWTRNPGNPLIPAAPVSPANRDFRDPYVFKEGGTWYMIVGSGLQTPFTGTVLLYKSTDLISWQFLNPLFVDNSGFNSVGNFWEMPVFWKFGTKYMLLVNRTPVGNVPAKAFYWVGNFAGETFTPANPVIKNLEIINSLLSPTVYTDEQNRVTAIGIIPDLLPASEQYNHGWANLFSLPRVWQLVNDSLFQSPHPNLDAGRGTVTNFSNLTIQPSSSNYFFGLRGFRAEIKATINLGTASSVGFILEKNDNNTEYTKIYYDVLNRSFVVDRSKSSLNANTPKDIQTEFFSLPINQPMDWHIYIDGSVIEVFINNKFAFATRIYPTNNTSNLFDLFSEGGNATATSVQIWSRGDVITGISEPDFTAASPLKVWPVPANNMCYIKLPDNASGNMVLFLYDINGRKVKTVQHKVFATAKSIEFRFNAGNQAKLPPGNYYCLMRLNNREFYKAKLIIAQ